MVASFSLGRLDGWLSHSHENPRGCMAVQHGTKSADVMVALSSLGPHRWTTSHEEMKPAPKVHQPTAGPRKPSRCSAHTRGPVYEEEGSEEVQQRHYPLTVVVLPPRCRLRAPSQLEAASEGTSLVRPQGCGAGCGREMNAPRFRPLGRLLYRELDDLPLLELREGHGEHF
jgi:hypothetical protein